MTFKIRLMNNSDMERVYAIESSVHIAPWSKEILRDCFMVGYDCRVLELYNEQEKKLNIAGYTIARYHNRSYHLLNLCIAKEMQSQGLGKKLLQSVIGTLGQGTNLDSVILEVRSSNAVALHLYASMGFQQIDIKKEYYSNIDGKEDAVILKKYIK